MVALAPHNINDPRNLNELKLCIHNLNSLKRADYDFIYRNIFKKINKYRRLGILPWISANNSQNFIAKKNYEFTATCRLLKIYSI